MDYLIKSVILKTHLERSSSGGLQNSWPPYIHNHIRLRQPPRASSHLHSSHMKHSRPCITSTPRKHQCHMGLQVVKACANRLPSVFTTIFNQPMKQPTVPTCLKIATISPVPKTSAVTGLIDYWPGRINALQLAPMQYTKNWAEFYSDLIKLFNDWTTGGWGCGVWGVGHFLPVHQSNCKWSAAQPFPPAQHSWLTFEETCCLSLWSKPFLLKTRKHIILICQSTVDLQTEIGRHFEKCYEH